MEEWKKIYRSEENKIIAGVAAGIAEYFKVDPTIIRVIFIILVLSGGSGVIIYLLLWLLIPSRNAPKNIGQENIIRQNVEDIKNQAENVFENFKSKEIIVDDNEPGNRGGELKKFFGFLLLALGIIFLLSNFGFFRWDLFWPFVLILLGFYLLTRK